MQSITRFYAQAGVRCATFGVRDHAQQGPSLAQADVSIVSKPKDQRRRPLTETDQRLLRILERDARKPVVALAKAVGLSRSAVQARLDRLEEEGVIAHYTIVRGDGYSEPQLNVLFQLKTNGNESLIWKLKEQCEVRYAWAVSGSDFDLLLLVRVEAAEQISNLRAAFAKIGGILDIRTALVLKRHFDRRAQRAVPIHRAA